jgi:hypothetical protein
MADRWGSGLPKDGEPKILYYPTLASRAADVGGWFALVLEGLIAGSMSVLLFNLPAFWAFAIGVTVCVATAIFIKGLFAPILLARAEAHPKQAAHWIMVTLLIVIPIEFALLTCAFLVRGATGDFALAIGWTFGAVLAILSMTTPILAAFLFTAAGLFGWSHRLTRRYDEARHLERDIESLRLSCERELEELSAAQGGEVRVTAVEIKLKSGAIEGGQPVMGEVHLFQAAPDGGAQIMLSTDNQAVHLPSSIAISPHSKVAWFAGTTTAVLEPVAAMISAKLGPTTSTAILTLAPTRDRHVGFGLSIITLVSLLGLGSPVRAQELGRFWIDATPSVVSGDLELALKHSREQLREVSTGSGIRRWEFYRFADDAWSTGPYSSVVLPTATRCALSASSGVRGREGFPWIIRGSEAKGRTGLRESAGGQSDPVCG